MWPEIEKAKTENRHEIVLSGKEVSQRIEKDGLDLTLFSLDGLNYVNISDTSLSVIPDEINLLTNLQTLVLHSNKIEIVTEAISKLEKLKTLDLSRNMIKQVPNSISGLLQLVSLNLSGNKLEAVPVFAKNSKLAVIDLSNNSLKCFPDVCYEELVNLSELKLSGNGIEAVPPSIRKLPSLKLLDVSSNNIKVLPGELADCGKLKEINLKSNPISDRRLLKLIDQCRTKQIIDYVKLNCPRTLTDAPSDGTSRNGNNRKKKTSNDDEDDGEMVESKYCIFIKPALDDFKVILDNGVKNVREHFVGCLVNNVNFTEDTYKKFIQVQNKLHDSICEKRNSATIATHDFNKLPPGDLTYTSAPPNELTIKPLNRSNTMTGAELFGKLQTEANNFRKEKKRNTYSGIHKFLYLIEGKPQYPCLLNAKNEVISFPPITNSDISKIEPNTTRIFVEVTSSVSQYICKTVLDTLLKELALLMEKDIEVQQVKTTNGEGQLKTVYPSKTDLKFDKNVPIRISRE